MSVDSEKPEKQQPQDNSETEAPDPAPTSTGNQAGLPWSFVAAAAGGVFLLMNKEKLGQDGGFIYIIAAVFLAIASANMLAKK